MKERPILFSAPMVRAILDGRKTVTRRIVRERIGSYSDGSFVVLDKDGDPIDVELRRPYGEPGDHLYVRETWRGHAGGIASDGYELGVAYAAGGYKSSHRNFVSSEEYSRYIGDAGGTRWRPSIHMPRWASRLLLEVVSVRVERLQWITEEDAKREGVSLPERPYPDGTPPHRAAFAALWDEINGKRAPWTSNPWVWRVEFRVVSP